MQDFHRRAQFVRSIPYPDRQQAGIKVMLDGQGADECSWIYLLPGRALASVRQKRWPKRLTLSSAAAARFFDLRAVANTADHLCQRSHRRLRKLVAGISASWLEPPWFHKKGVTPI